MTAIMAAKIRELMYLSSPFRYKDKWSVDSYEMNVVEYEYVK